MEKGIRVNAVAPGPIYSPLIPATFDEEKVEHQGDETPMGRRTTSRTCTFLCLLSNTCR